MLIRTELKFLCTAILIAYDIVRQAWFSFKPQLAIFCPEMEFTKSEFSSDTAHGVCRFHSACEITAKAKRKISSKPLKRTIFILAKRNLASFQLDFLHQQVYKLDFTIMRPPRVHSRIFTRHGSLGSLRFSKWRYGPWLVALIGPVAAWGRAEKGINKRTVAERTKVWTTEQCQPSKNDAPAGYKGPVCSSGLDDKEGAGGGGLLPIINDI